MLKYFTLSIRRLSTPVQQPTVFWANFEGLVCVNVVCVCVCMQLFDGCVSVYVKVGMDLGMVVEG